MKSIINKLGTGMALVSLAVMFGGCGTIMNGGSTMVSINSVPRADVSIDGKKYGKTPIKVPRSNDKDHAIHLQAKGYRPYDTRISSKFSAWYFGNLIPMFFPGLILDPVSGGMWYLSTNNLSQRMIKSNAQSSLLEKLESENAKLTH